MAKVKITGHASGSGVITVTAPNTSTDRTITLPDGDVTLGAATPSITDNGNANAITIDSAENVGIGVTPEAWHNDYRNLAVGGTGALWSQKAVGTGKAMGVGQNVYYDGSNKYITTDEASRYYQANGVHTFEVAASGSADAAISFATAMSIDNSGYVTKPLQPAFLARGLSSVTAVGSVFLFNSIIFNRSSSYSASNGRFTAPVAGVYLFTFSSMGNSTDNRYMCRLYLNGVNYAQSSSSSNASQYQDGKLSILMFLSVNDYVQMSNSGTKIAHSTAVVEQWFSGHLVG